MYAARALSEIATIGMVVIVYDGEPICALIVIVVSDSLRNGRPKIPPTPESLFLQRRNRGPSSKIREGLRKSFSGIQFAFTYGVEFMNQWGNSNANRNNRKNQRSP
jgi:hypothetical protein